MYVMRRQLVEAILAAHSVQLVNNLITGAVFVLPPYMHHEVAETLLQVSHAHHGPRRKVGPS